MKMTLHNISSQENNLLKYLKYFESFINKNNYDLNRVDASKL